MSTVYNVATYGEELYDGELNQDNTSLLWSFIVAWNGSYTGENEALYMLDVNSSRGRSYMLRSDGAGFERVSPGRLSIVLDNSTRRYDPYNASSPLYPYVIPGKKCRLAVKDTSTDITYEIMRGVISDIQPYKRGGVQCVRIDIKDGLSWLVGRETDIGLRQNSSIYPYAYNSAAYLADLILQDIGWPDSEWPRVYDFLTQYNLSQGHPLPFAWFSYQDALRAIYDLADTEAGVFFQAKDGTIRFLDSEFEYDTSTSVDESELLRDILIQQPWETVRNRISVPVHNISVHDTDVVVFDLGTEAPAISSQGQLVLYAELRYDNMPVSATSGGWVVTANTAADGSGTFFSSSVAVLRGDREPNLTGPAGAQTGGSLGNKIRVVLKNNSTNSGYILGLVYTGADPIYAPYTTSVIEINQSSIDTFGDRKLLLSSPWTQETEYARVLAVWLLDNLKDARAQPTIQIEARPSLQFALDLFVDRILLTIPTMGIQRFYRIGRIEHQWLGENGQAVRTTWKLEPYFLPIGADPEYDCVLSNDFGDISEGNCSTPPAGEMSWCLTEWVHDRFNSDGHPTATGKIYLHISTTATDAAMAYTDAESHVIKRDEAFSFDYRYSDSDTFPIVSYPLFFIHFDVTSPDGNTTKVFSTSIPFDIVTGSGPWTHFAYQFPITYVGWTLTQIQIDLNDANAPGIGTNTSFYLTNTCIGVPIG